MLKTINLPKEFGPKYQGNDRDFWIVGDKRIMVTTDRQSEFNVVLGHVPYKGAVLNQLAGFWFEKTKTIVPNHMIEIPDPNVLVSRNCEPIPVEMVVQGYIGGVTKTSIWYSYQKGERQIYGVRFPEGMKKNEKLPKYVVIPTTHPATRSDLYDERLTRDKIIKRKIVPKKLYEEMERISLKLFDFGTKWCAKQGIILVDTKYEFGLYNGKLMVINKIHTPDSTRFWIKKTYEKRLTRGEEPEHFDEEFLRLWYAARGYTGEGAPPKMTPWLRNETAKRYISVYEKITGSKFNKFNYPINTRIKKAILASYEPTRLTYAEVGDNYDTKDPIKKLAQVSAAKTGANLRSHQLSEVEDSRGESAYVWKQGKIYMASMIEGLGTKNLVADGMRKTTGKTYYDIAAHDTVATIINDLISVGATPLVLHAYWAIDDNSWLDDQTRMTDLITGWKKACDVAGVSWGGGETPTLKQIMIPGTAELAGSAVGIIKTKSRLVVDTKMKNGDRIILLKSNGVNANGISLTRAIAAKLPEGYATRLADGTYYGEALLTKSNIYAKFITALQDAGVDIHYLSNITGHGLRKVMRARPNFTYHITNLFEPQEIFKFIQQHASLSQQEMYSTYNMGNDFMIVIARKDVKKTLAIAKKHKQKAIEAGYIENGEKKVVIHPKNITFDASTLDLR